MTGILRYFITPALDTNCQLHQRFLYHQVATYHLN